MQVNVKTDSSTQSKITEDANRASPIGTRKGRKKSAAKGRRRVAKKTVKAIINSTQRHQLISEAAYYNAERRGFEGDDTLGDWLHAESYIDSMYRIEG